MRFADPACLILLLLAAGHAWRHWPRRRRPPPGALAVPSLAWLDGPAPGPRARWAWLPVALRTAVLALLVVALARPQTVGEAGAVTTRSRNLVLALDISSSMKAVDFTPGNRLEAAKRVLADFVRRREGDLIGLVLFASRAFTQAPLTVDTGLLLELLRRVEIGLLPDGTAIGTALATSLALVEHLPPRSSAVVLVTDGGNNTGRPGPLTAAEAARALGIRVYAVGLTAGGAAGTGGGGAVGTGGGAPVAPGAADSAPPAAREAAAPGPGPAEPGAAGSPAAQRPSPAPAVEPPARIANADEAVLQRVAARTGGRYYRASDPDALARIVAEIDRLERTEVRVKTVRQYRERYALALAPALVLLLLEALLRAIWLRELP